MGCGCKEKQKMMSGISGRNDEKYVSFADKIEAFKGLNKGLDETANDNEEEDVLDETEEKIISMVEQYSSIAGLIQSGLAFYGIDVSSDPETVLKRADMIFFNTIIRR